MNSSITRKAATATYFRYLGCGLLLVLSAAVAAQQGLKIELNKLESVEGACRAYLVFENKGSIAYTALKLDLVMFGPDGVINKRLAVEGAPLPTGKTSVKLFDITDISCAEVARILLNDVLQCAAAEGGRDNCLSEIQVVSRGAAEFFK